MHQFKYFSSDNLDTKGKRKELNDFYKQPKQASVPVESTVCIITNIYFKNLDSII